MRDEEIEDLLIDEAKLVFKYLLKMGASKEDGKQNTIIIHLNIRSEKTVYGIKAYNADNEKIEDPLQYFIWALENGKEYDTRYRGEFERVYHYVVGQDGKITKEDINVFGVVVTGDVESLKNLQGFPFIKSSSIGVVTEKF